jgi:hypothetical protein
MVTIHANGHIHLGSHDAGYGFTVISPAESGENAILGGDVPEFKK